MVGRLPGNDIVVADDACSSQHARIRIERDAGEEKRFLLIDMASRNGTFAGDRTSYRQNRVHHYELRDGDFLLLGETTLVFKQV
jgi:pSer/pThr/pTyr-binding forkhead associated (FHA) protein